MLGFSNHHFKELADGIRLSPVRCEDTVLTPLTEIMLFANSSAIIPVVNMFF